MRHRPKLYSLKYFINFDVLEHLCGLRIVKTITNLVVTQFEQKTNLQL
jgi:hypothetical protein